MKALPISLVSLRMDGLVVINMGVKIMASSTFSYNMKEFGVGVTFLKPSDSRALSPIHFLKIKGVMQGLLKFIIFLEFRF